MKSWKTAVAAAAPVILLAGCGDVGTPLTVTEVVCARNPAYDSDELLGVAIPNTSWDKGSPVYTTLNSRKDSGGTPITVGYMFHPSQGTAKALIVLFAGGDGTTAITHSGSTLTGNGNNFLVRSANLYAAQGFDVATIDKPSDEPTYTYGWQYDSYRTSMRHSVDVSTVLNDANSSGLPVLFAGTSRGAISIVTNSKLAAGLDLSSPVTSGNGTPVGATGSPAMLQPSSVSVPVQITWNRNDGCSVSTPTNSRFLGQRFQDAGVTTTATRITGGLGNYSANICKALTYHGFYGVESCAVEQETGWATNVTTNLAAGGNNRPVAGAIASSTSANVPVAINLSTATSDADLDALSYSLPYTTTSLGGTLLQSGSMVTYSPPAGVSGTDDTFVYTVDDGNGGVANNVVTVTVN